jgi:hypothetical protein
MGYFLSILKIKGDKMSLADAFAPAEDKYKAEVMAETWGHLAPKMGKVYKGSIIFAYGEYGDITPIKCEFADLDDSPWFFDDMVEFIWQKAKNKQGKVLKFVGIYKKLKNKGIFSGKITIVI